MSRRELLAWRVKKRQKRVVLNKRGLRLSPRTDLRTTCENEERPTKLKKEGAITGFQSRPQKICSLIGSSDDGGNGREASRRWKGCSTKGETWLRRRLLTERVASGSNKESEKKRLSQLISTGVITPLELRREREEKEYPCFSELRKGKTRGRKRECPSWLDRSGELERKKKNMGKW